MPVWRSPYPPTLSSPLCWTAKNSLKRKRNLRAKFPVTPIRPLEEVKLTAAIPTSTFLSAVRSQSNPSLPSPTVAALLLRTPFLGPSILSLAVAQPSIRIASLPSKNRLRVRFQEKQVALVPRENRWMYEESEINGPDIWNKTWYPKAAGHLTTEKTWYIVDATDKILGRLASTIGIHIRGKNLATYTPSVDMGAYVIVVNAEKVAVSDKKRTQKLYRRHSGRPGGMKVETFDQLQERIPERIINMLCGACFLKGRSRGDESSGTSWSGNTSVEIS